jgi:hypothetical protein
MSTYAVDRRSALGVTLGSRPLGVCRAAVLRVELARRFYRCEIARPRAIAEIAQPALTFALERSALSLEIALRPSRFELQKLWRVTVAQWPIWRTRIEYVTHLGEVVTVNGEPVWVEVIEIVRD